MKKFTEKDYEKIEEKVYSVGVDLSIVASLVKFLDLAMNDDLNVNYMDMSNLTAAIKRHICDIRDKYDKIECLLDV